MLRCIGIQIAQSLHQGCRVRRAEQAFDAVAVKICEWAFVQELRVHHAARSLVIDDKIEKFKLVSGENFAADKSRKRLLRRGEIEANQ